MKATVTFIRYYNYDVEGVDEDDCYDKAYSKFAREQTRVNYSTTSFDDYEIDVIDYSDDEEE